MILAQSNVLEILVLLIHQIIRVVRFGQVLTEHIVKPLPAVFTLANALVAFGIVQRDGIASHVQENAIRIHIPDDFPNDVHGNLLLVVAVEAHMNQAVVIDDLPLGADIGPLRVLLIQGLAHLGEIHSTDDPNARILAHLDHRFQAIAGEETVAGVKRNFRLIAGNNAAGIDDNRVRVEILQFPDILSRIHICHVDFTQIGLNNSPRPILPPKLFAHAFILSL